MARKLKKSDKQKKEEKKLKKEIQNKVCELADENYPYYVLISAIRGFLDMSTGFLKVRKQVDQTSKIQIINCDIYEKQEYWSGWIDVMNRLLKFIIKKYPNGKNDMDFNTMEFEKIQNATIVTKRLHFQDLIRAFGSNFNIKERKFREEMFFLANTVSYFKVIEECAFNKNLKMDINERRTIRTIITKYKKNMFPDIIDIIAQ